MAGPFLREDQFARLYGLFQEEPKIHTKEREHERRFLEAVYWMDRSGAQWRFARRGDLVSGSGSSVRWRTTRACRAR